jgi:hypothetical protein
VNAKQSPATASLPAGPQGQMTLQGSPHGPLETPLEQAGTNKDKMRQPNVFKKVCDTLQVKELNFAKKFSTNRVLFSFMNNHNFKS